MVFWRELYAPWVYMFFHFHIDYLTILISFSPIHYNVRCFIFEVFKGSFCEFSHVNFSCNKWNGKKYYFLWKFALFVHKFPWQEEWSCLLSIFTIEWKNDLLQFFPIDDHCCFFSSWRNSKAVEIYKKLFLTLFKLVNHSISIIWVFTVHNSFNFLIK